MTSPATMYYLLGVDAPATLAAVLFAPVVA